MSVRSVLAPGIHLLEYGYTKFEDGHRIVDLQRAQTPCPAGLDISHGIQTIFVYDDAKTCKACLAALPNSASLYKTGLLVT